MPIVKIYFTEAEFTEREKLCATTDDPIVTERAAMPIIEACEKLGDACETCEVYAPDGRLLYTPAGRVQV